MVTRIELPKQPVRPVCSRCVNYGGDAHLKRNGVKCVLCRLDNGWIVTPMRGTRSKSALPCTYYQSFSTLEGKIYENN